MEALVFVGVATCIGYCASIVRAALHKRCAVVSSDDEDEDEVVSEDMEAVLYQAELLQHMEDEHKRNLAESESPRLLVHPRDTMEAAEPH
eukprot:3644335-Prymnesium_polylepis.1